MRKGAATDCTIDVNRNEVRKMKEVIKKNPNEFSGCDFVIQLDEARKNTPIKLLQLTDMQVIDAQQRRTPDRIRSDEIAAWQPELFMGQCGNHIQSLVTQTKPDLIFITGDIVYGSFDDNGSIFEMFCSFMDSLKIPWAPVFGNHDNESYKGVAWQCEQFEKSEYCVFARGDVSGNGNYTVGIAVGNELVRVLHMTDSNGCVATEQEDVIRIPGIYNDQLALIEEKSEKIRRSQEKEVPAFMAFHIPTDSFSEAEIAKGYKTDEHPFYTIGVDVEQAADDFGFNYENYGTIKTECDFIDFLHRQHIDGVFAGHCHKICTCISYCDIRFVFGLKTGQYDYHLPGSLGGTLVTLEGKGFDVKHIPAAVPYAPMPKAPFFADFFAE